MLKHPTEFNDVEKYCAYAISKVGLIPTARLVIAFGDMPTDTATEHKIVTELYSKYSENVKWN